MLQINVSSLPDFTEGGGPLYLFNNTLDLYDLDSINRSAVFEALDVSVCFILNMFIVLFVVLCIFSHLLSI